MDWGTCAGSFWAERLCWEASGWNKCSGQAKWQQDRGGEGVKRWLQGRAVFFTPPCATRATSYWWALGNDQLECSQMLHLHCLIFHLFSPPRSFKSSVFPRWHCENPFFAFYLPLSYFNLCFWNKWRLGECWQGGRGMLFWMKNVQSGLMSALPVVGCEPARGGG